MEELSIENSSVSVTTVTRIIYTIIGLVIGGSAFILGINYKADTTLAMASENKADLASLRAEYEHVLPGYYTNIATLNTNLDSMQKQLNRIESKLDNK